MRELPNPDTHCFDDDTGKDVWSHSRDQVLAIQKQAYEDGLRDAAVVCADYAASIHDEINGRNFFLFEASRRITAMLKASKDTQ